MTVGIVVVSHSAALAAAACELARQMVPNGAPPIAVAAGTSDGRLGTDATVIAAAMDSVASASGVLVLMDLGSAILSSEMALEFAVDASAVGEVRLSQAPFIEGLIAATVRASTGGTLDDVDADARAALTPKAAQLGDATATHAPVGVGVASGNVPASAPTASSANADVVTARVIVRNPSGLHARPAALVAQAAGGFASSVTVANVLRGGAPVQADSSIMLMSLGVTQGSEVEIAAQGPDAAAAVAAIVALFDGGFGEA